MIPLVKWHILVLLILCQIKLGSCQSAGKDLEKIEEVSQSVGYALHHVYDSTRTYSAPDSLDLPNNFRPMQISEWYPSENRQDIPMPYKEYLHAILTEEHFRKLNRLEKQSIENSFKNAASVVFKTSSSNKRFLDSLLNSKTRASKNAKTAKGSFPLIIYAPGNDPGGTYGSSMENSLLFEYLASHGYIVAAIPSYRGRQFSETKNQVKSQALDQKFLLDWMKKRPYVDTTKIAAMAYSFGGVGQIIHAHNNIEIKAIASLESGVTFKEMYERLHTYEQYQNLLPQSFDVPFLHFASTPLWKNQWAMTLNDVFVKETNGPSYLVKFKKAGHRDMASDQIYTLVMANKDGDTIQETKEFPLVDQKASVMAYELLCKTTLEFFEQHLKLNKGSLDQWIIEPDFLKAAEVNIYNTDNIHNYVPSKSSNGNLNLFEFDYSGCNHNAQDTLLYTKAKASFAAGKLRMALQSINKAIEKKNIWKYRGYKAEILRMLNLTQEAIAIYEREAEESREPLKYLQWIIMTHVLTGKLDSAMQQIEVLESEYPTEQRLRAQKAWIYAKQGKYDSAIEHYGSNDAALGWVYAMKCDGPSTQKYLQNLLKAPGKKEWWNKWDIALIYAAIPNKKKAIQWLAEIVNELADTDQEELVKLGWRMTIESDYDKLRDELKFQQLLKKTNYNVNIKCF